MKDFIAKHSLILMEAAISEPLYRDYQIPRHQYLTNAPAIYSESGRKALRTLYQSYLNVAQRANVPMMLMTPTSRANAERVRMESGMERINQDAARFLQELKAEQGPHSVPLKIGGLMTCKNDMYAPEQGLSTEAAERFHEWQLAELVDASIDYLIAQTLPALPEAIGIARAMAKTNVQYIISFVINREGRLLDGTTLVDAIAAIDQAATPQPLCYMMNCSYPTFLHASQQPRALFTRLLGCQANASSLDHAELDGAPDQKHEGIAEWGAEMVRLHKEFGMKLLGGCCGTRKEHLERIVRLLSIGQKI